MTTPVENSLESYLAIPFSEELPETAPSIDGDVEASATLRRLTILRESIAGNQAVADAETTKINLWEREANAPLERQAQFFEGILEGYMRHVRDSSEGKKKSITLPGGAIKTTATQDKWEVADQEAFIKWARAAQLVQLYKVKYVAETLTTIKSTFVDDGDGNAINPVDGEIVPGLKISKPASPYTIKITTK